MERRPPQSVQPRGNQAAHHTGLVVSFDKQADLLPGRRAIVDGEIVALSPAGVPSFVRLQERMNVAAPSPGLLARAPARLYVFDVLYLDDLLLLPRPYAERRTVLAELGLDGPIVPTPPHWTDTTGEALLEAARTHGLEGVVAKRLHSPYQPGTRSRLWIKQAVNPTIDVIVGGWQPGAGRRHGTIGSLVLGMYDQAGDLRYVGRVGSGLTDADLLKLGALLEQLRRPTTPFIEVPREHARNAVWVEPRLDAEVVYRDMTPTGAYAYRSGAACARTSGRRTSCCPVRPEHDETRLPCPRTPSARNEDTTCRTGTTTGDLLAGPPHLPVAVAGGPSSGLAGISVASNRPDPWRNGDRHGLMLL